MKNNIIMALTLKTLFLAATIDVAAAIDIENIQYSTNYTNNIRIESTIDQPRLKSADRLDQADIANGDFSLRQIRKAGLLVFTTPFNAIDGHGDGAFDPSGASNRLPGNRPTLQGNGVFLRVNGLDSQTCLECHTITSNAIIPAKLGVGGVGGVSQNAIVKPSHIDVADENKDGVAGFDGRFINPPFLFGSGGVELVGLEMTRDLQLLKKFAIEHPGDIVELSTKGITFGEIVADVTGNVNTSAVVGITADLVVKPFGRKGEFATVREFDVDAMAFHLGMQATELVGEGVDADGDGVVNELKDGDLSALSIFNTTMNRPFKSPRDSDANIGSNLFNSIGCADCHKPELNTFTKILPYKIIGANHQPFKDSFFSVDLTRHPMRFKQNTQGGIRVKLFSDLKRHFMGEGLKESFSLATDKENGEFITARLWGIADTAPYLHDGRARTLEQAIRMHDNPGSEASSAAESFKALSPDDQLNIIKFLNTLRTPSNPNTDVVRIR